MKTLGIDPGVNGGIAAIDGDESQVWPMPATVGDLVDLLRSLAVAGFVNATCENVHSSPQMGVVSAFTFGRGVGNIEATCQTLCIRLNWVTPQTWQKAMRCLSKGDKNVTKRRAQELFPAIKVTHATADALLIADYGRCFGAGMVDSSTRAKKAPANSLYGAFTGLWEGIENPHLGPRRRGWRVAMIRDVEVNVVCDKCGDNDRFNLEVVDECDLETELESNGWQIVDGKHICDVCVEDDEEAAPQESQEGAR